MNCPLVSKPDEGVACNPDCAWYDNDSCVCCIRFIPLELNHISDTLVNYIDTELGEIKQQLNNIAAAVGKE